MYHFGKFVITIKYHNYLLTEIYRCDFSVTYAKFRISVSAAKTDFFQIRHIIGPFFSCYYLLK